jgi:hypothetical protein
MDAVIDVPVHGSSTHLMWGDAYACSVIHVKGFQTYSVLVISMADCLGLHR